MAFDDNSTIIWSKKLQKIEALIVSGKHDEARQIFNQIKLKSIPKQWSAAYAQLALRFRDSISALKILHPILFPENTFEKHASSADTIAYAYALTNLSAVPEALEMLSKLDASEEPEALFQKAMAFFKVWNYEEAAPILKEFIASRKINDYRRLVGKLNLAAALICLEDWKEARPLLAEIEETCKKGNFGFLLGNCYELYSQINVFAGQYQQAIFYSEKSIECLKNEKGIYTLLARKWEAIGYCLSEPSEANLKKLKEVRRQAETLLHWETLRECDLFEAKLTGNELLFQKVIMGTPFKNYRRRARIFFDSSTRPVGTYELHFPGIDEDSGNRTIFDPYAKNSNGQGLFERPYLLYLFEALTQDFYKPSYLGSLFRALYPEEKFNPFSSPARVLRLLKNLDKWFQQADVPLRIRFKSSEFQLTSIRPCVVIVRRGLEIAPADAQLVSLKKAFGDKPFSSTMAANALGISKTTALKLVKQATDSGKISKFKNGRASSYQFSSKRKSIARAA